MMCNARRRLATGLQLRVARHTERLPELVAFYTAGIGLVEIGSFRDHGGYSGVFLGIPGTEAHLELTSGGAHRAPPPHVESLLVLYVGDQHALDTIARRLAIKPVMPANPYWSEHGLTFEDPDGFRIVLVPERWRAHSSAAERVRVERHFGPRSHLRSLFGLAEDSARALESYIDAGAVYTAQEGSRAVGYVQVTPTDREDTAEIKSIAVDRALQGQGIGRTLVATAFEHARTEGRLVVVVGTAAADTGNLRFYQRLGFRMRCVERDAFTEANGYDGSLEIEGVALRDRVWLELSLNNFVNGRP